MRVRSLRADRVLNFTVENNDSIVLPLMELDFFQIKLREKGERVEGKGLVLFCCGFMRTRPLKGKINYFIKGTRFELPRFIAF
jgi:hypothetical protein